MKSPASVVGFAVVAFATDHVTGEARSDLHAHAHANPLSLWFQAQYRGDRGVRAWNQTCLFSQAPE